jgi:hypothetical protein
MIGIATVLCCPALFPQEAEAQCAVSYNNTFANDAYVYAEGSVADYYGSEPCGGYGPYFFHDYSVLIQIACGTQYVEENFTYRMDYGSGYVYGGSGVNVTEMVVCDVNISLVIWCSALSASILEEYVQTQTPTCSLTAKFSGGLTSGNNLSFAPASYVCGGDSLGVVDCSAHWLGKVEIRGSVSDNASTWATRQSYTGRRLRILGTNPQTDDTLNDPNDDPDPTFVQKPSGQTQVFWLDAPGHTKTVGGQTVTSLNQIQNFTSRLQKGSSSCQVQWHLKVEVTGGSLSSSSFALGHISTN